MEHAARGMLADHTKRTWPLLSSALPWPHHGLAPLSGTAADALDILIQFATEAFAVDVLLYFSFT